MDIFFKISLNEYATVPYFQMKCRVSSAVYNVAMVTLRICYFFDFFFFFCLFGQLYCTQTKILMLPHSTKNFILYQLILLVKKNFRKNYSVVCCMRRCCKINYILQPRTSYNLNMHLKLTAGNSSITFLSEFD